MTTMKKITIKEKKDTFDKMAAKIPGAIRTKTGVIIPIDDKGGIFHVTDFGPINTAEDQKFGDLWGVYKVICNEADLDRIVKPSALDDYLLKIRAESILDNPRLIRVFQKRFNNSEGMTLSKWYNRNDRQNLYINNVSKGNHDKLFKVPVGTAMISRANAICMPVDKGNIIIVSEKLIYALYFFNIFLFGQSLDFTDQECFTAYVIALRVYYGHESLDFDLDPRGDFPEYIENHLQEITTMQYNFILGHEYAHHLLGHLKESKLVDEYLLNSDNSSIFPHYKHRFKEEYDADWHSIKNIKGDNNYRSSLADAAFTCFYFFYVLEQVGEYFSPQGKSHAKTHPYALDRMRHLRSHLKSSCGISREYLDKTKQYIDQVTGHFLNEILPYHVDEFERYGSHYFKRFKDKILRDRVDY
ncbi:hypothetical protein J1779_04785 [Rahnella sp. FC061912-K]|uniref:hypothetical protein n=1 Tax=Rahnella rivi TaxID=2816249 RepID=UPI001C278C15|nr:hypothetical protein [Rahnella rivi]MBU9829236.1 hypothetical protein [Rahnella rivi]